MPGKYVVKEYVSKHYYHIVTRGVNKQAIFIEDGDYTYFISLFKRYLSGEPAISKARTLYPSYHSRIELVAFCLMPNHIHVLVFQQDERAMPDLMHSIMTSYSMYFNLRYKRVGPVFQSRYHAKLILDEGYLEHITRYIHMNPNDWEKYSYSSLAYFLGLKSSEWLCPESVLRIFGNQGEYLKFLKDYEGQKQLLKDAKNEMAE